MLDADLYLSPTGLEKFVEKLASEHELGHQNIVERVLEMLFEPAVFLARREQTGTQEPRPS
jgi:hypothetical protein